MYSQPFSLSIANDQEGLAIDFANNTAGFVEVVFDIDGQLVKGYCFPPNFRKAFRKVRTGEMIKFRRGGKIKASVYVGVGRFREIAENLQVPTFIRRKLNATQQKVTFHRTQQAPAAVLEAAY
ncbi:MAG: hypothetical protein WD970_00990 [Patescibacteria group bacterium]